MTEYLSWGEGEVVREVRCPICLDMFSWPTGDALYEFNEKQKQFIRLTIPPGTDPVKRGDIMRTAYLRCPNPSEDFRVHYLPAAYASFGKPLVIGLVGSTMSGKSHLLAAMIAEIERGGLQPYRLTSRPVDFALHADFMRDYANKVVVQGQRLRRTQENLDSYADALLITSASGTSPVAFFDIAGGDLVQTGKPGRFLAAAGGLIFVVDPNKAVLNQGSDSTLGDETFATVLGRLGSGDVYIDIPAAVAVSKADQLRFRPPADKWLHRPSAGRVDAAAMRAESRDAFAFLYQHDARAWLRPFYECRRCTLHFVSATGREALEDSYLPRGVRPRRVLEPLIALLAMAGIIPGAESAKVGRS